MIGEILTLREVKLVGEDPECYLEGNEVTYINENRVKVKRLLEDDNENIEPGDTVVLEELEEQKGMRFKQGYGISGTVTINGKEVTAYETITRGCSTMFIVEV